MYQSSTMSEPLQKKNSEKTELTTSTSSAAAFPAKMCHVPALEKALKRTMDKLLAADYGGNTQGSLANLGPDGLWQKMSEGCCQQVLISDQAATLELFSGTWPTWGMMLAGVVTEQKPLVRPTKEKESLLWPTARANKIGGSTSEGYGLCLEEAVNGGRKEKMWPTPVASDGAQGAVIGKDDTFYTTSTGMPRKVNRNGTDGSVGLGRLVKLWPTPRVADTTGGDRTKWVLEGKWGNKGLREAVNIEQMQNWPTPNARDWKDSGDMQKLADNTHQITVPKAVAKLDVNQKGNLSADWVEILMGLPIGWTNTECDEPTPWPGWPAPLGANQYPYEPPRVVEGQKNRAKRLKCLGNGCCPEQIAPIFKAIMEVELDTQN